MKQKQIGKARLSYLDDNTPHQYVDSAEKELLTLFKNKPESILDKEISRILSNNPSWDLYYNLTPQRRHILDWYPFKKQSSLLEIGAGTGAITRVFLDRASHVTSLELTNTRAEILAHRFQDRKNLEVIAGNIDLYNTNKKFDYIVLNGVLEYAGMFASNSNASFSRAHEYVLQKCISYLKKSGTVFIAIENPIGVRYLSGALEDHYGDLFQGVENYPAYNGIRTYTKSELAKILINSGFKNIEVYLPIPDYKIPQLVISEEYLLKHRQISLSSFMHNVDMAHPLLTLFSEILLSHQLSKEEVLSKFSNSFLFIAQKK